VLCVHRGDEPYEDMFDGRPYKIQPGFFMTQYGAALHFKARAVVPGTRNPETRYEASFIAIVGVVELKPDGTFTRAQGVDDRSSGRRSPPRSVTNTRASSRRSTATAWSTRSMRRDDRVDERDGGRGRSRPAVKGGAGAKAAAGRPRAWHADRSRPTPRS
jgi:hypothetical protein